MSHKSGFVVERAEEIVIRLDKGRGKTTQTSADGEEIGGRTTARCRVQPQFKPRTRRLEMKQKQFHSINIAVCVCVLYFCDWRTNVRGSTGGEWTNLRTQRSH